MAFVNAFQSGQQFQSLQNQRAQNLRTGEQNILTQQRQNERADKSFAAREEQRGITNQRRATSDERLAAADEVDAAERDRVAQLRATQNTVKFIKAGVASGRPIEEILQGAAQPLQALGVTPDQFGELAQQIGQDPAVLDQFEAALRQQTGPRRAVGRPVPVRIGDRTALLQTFSDGSSEVVEGVTPLQEELGARRAAVAEARVDPTRRGAIREEETVGAGRGAVRVGDLPRGRRATEAAKRATSSRQQRFDVINTNIDKAIDAASSFTVGPGSLLSFVPGTPQRDLAATLDTIRANVGFEELGRLREQSPTGGALGQVSERENILLQSVLGSIEQSQSPKQFRANLKALRDQFKLSQSRIAQAFEDDFGVPYAGPGTPIPSVQGAQPSGLQGMSDAELDAAIAEAGG